MFKDIQLGVERLLRVETRSLKIPFLREDGRILILSPFLTEKAEVLTILSLTKKWR